MSGVSHRPPTRSLEHTTEGSINVAGYLRAELGVGELGRLVLATLETAGFPCTTVAFDRTLNRQQAAFEDRRAAVDADINVICVNADQLPEFARSVGVEFFTDRYTIGYWAWEIDEFPARFDEAFDYVDEIWALSSFAAEAISARSPVPVRAAPLPVPTVVPPTGQSVAPHEWSLLDGTDRPVFLFAFDYLSVMERKNPMGLIEAFRRAFAPDEGPILVLKTINGSRQRHAREQLEQAAADRADIHLIDGYLSEHERDALLFNASAYVSLHRAEGYGLTIAEAMVAGIPTIATAYSGNLDFAMPDDPLLVPYELQPIGPGNEPYDPLASWAEPDLDAAAARMRRVVDDPAGTAKLAERVRDHTIEHHSVDARARLFASLVDEARERAANGSRVSDTIGGLLHEPVQDRAVRWVKDQLRPAVRALRRSR